MSHPTLWQKKTFFYPIGNTSPVCLTEALPPEESAQILLLGCGDPRSILYTLYAGLKTPAAARKLDFTCCDIEPAVLARNALLFTLIYDDHPIDRIWNIFYHFKLDDPSFSLLAAQCQKLIEISKSPDVWRNSRYSSFLKLCSSRTLSQLRTHWKLYAQAREFCKDKNRSLHSAIAHIAKDFIGSNARDTSNFTAARSAGPYWTYAAPLVGANFRHYWQTGVVCVEPEIVASAVLINPTFTYSLMGEQFAAHYGTYPLTAFHLAAAFGRNGAGNDTVTAADLVNCAKLQFRQWSDAFRAVLSSGSGTAVTIRLFAGDALAFCQTLHHCTLTSSVSASMFASSWCGAELVLDEREYGYNAVRSAPTTFNVIDTSNIQDHVGLLNILLVTAPLLCPEPSSILYTEALLAIGRDPMSGFTKRLCAEIPAFSLLSGIAPYAYLSTFMSHSNIHEIMALRLVCSELQYHERVAWKVPYLGDPIVLRLCGKSKIYPSFKPMELARLLFDVYYGLFADEDMAAKFRDMKNMALSPTIIHYHRGTFVALLGLVKERNLADWDQVMDNLFDLLHADRRLLLNSNFYQELCCQLHIRGIFSVETLGPQQTSVLVDRTKGRFRGWEDVPPAVCLVFVVPREKIRALEVMESRRLGSPMFQCEVRGSTFHNIFSCIQIIFGTVSIEGRDDKARAIIKEDAKGGWSGSSPLVVSTWVPSWILGIDPHVTRISLGVNSTPATAMTLSPILGLGLCLHTADFMDELSVHVLRERPHRPTELDSLLASMPLSPSETSEFHVSVGLDDTFRKVSTLVSRWDVVDDAARLALSTGAEVKVLDASPCTMEIRFDKYSRRVVYPFPVDGSRAKLRIARKSGYVEVVVPVSGLCVSGGFATKNFPLLSNGSVPTVWNVHRLSLDRLPILDLSNRSSTGWVCTHASLMFSDRERARRQAGYPGKPLAGDTIIKVKDTLHSIFTTVVGQEQRRIFGLADPLRGGVNTLVFVKHVRLDLASHTVVADACVVPLTENLVIRLSNILASLTAKGEIATIETADDEMVAWKHLLPAFTERCRTWDHKPSCEYVVARLVPVSSEFARIPICGCGNGIGLEAFSTIPGWGKFSAHATRAALSPLFAVSYLESVAGFAQIPVVSDTKDREAVGCGHCGGPGKPRLLKCTRCTKVSYCDEACQKADWKTHKMHCIPK